MYVDKCVNVFIGMCVDTCVDMRGDMCVDTCVDMRGDMCVDIHREMHIETVIDMCAGHRCLLVFVTDLCSAPSLRYIAEYL